MRTIVKSVSDLTAEEYVYCYRANLGTGGTMQSDLSALRKSEGFTARRFSNPRVIMAWDDDHMGASRLLGWCLFYYDNVFNRIDSGFYVKKKFRRKGVGTALMKELKNYSKRPVVHPWTEENGKFFSNFHVIADTPDSRKHWMDKRTRVC